MKTEADEWQGAFSPDGRWFAYMSNETGRDQVYVQPYPPTGAKWQVSTTGGEEPRWRGDGRELFYLSLDNHMMSVALAANRSDFNPGTPVPLFQARMSRAPADWDYDVTRQGDRFVINLMATEGQASAIHLIVGWKPPGQ